MKISICNELFEGWDIERIFDYAAQIGYNGVELAPFTLGETASDISAAARKKIRKAAENAGIEIVGLHWLLVKPEGLYINHPDAAIRTRTQNYLKELIDLCADLGGKVLVHGSPNQRSVKQEWDPAEAWKYARETFQICGEAARSRNVFYCLEALTTADTNFINSIDEALEMVAEVDQPHFQTMLDCRSIHAGVKSELPRVLQAALDTGKLKHVHVNDPNGRGPGFGRLQFAPLLRILQEADYSGYISVEVFDFKPDPQTVAGRSLGYLQGILESLGANVSPAKF
jgi:D-psicose/D-tagatose/L-ribulose 3-epimerase